MSATKKTSKWASKSTYTSQKIFDNSLVAILKSKVTLLLNKAAYIRMFILELNKVLVYEFHYYYIKNKYGKTSRLLFTDTDSLIYEIKTEDVYEDFSSDSQNTVSKLRQNTVMIQTN